MSEAIASFKDIVALAPQHEELLRALRALVADVHPGHIEVSRPGDRAVSWGRAPKKMSEAYACALPYRDHVNLAFYRGTALPHPAGRLKGSGKAMRHATLTHIGEVADPALRALLLAAKEERREALGLAKR